MNCGSNRRKPPVLRSTERFAPDGRFTRKFNLPHQETITIVSGLPRSGTSMMMQMLEQGGVQLLTDSKRRADRHNPKGYFEFERVKSLGKENGDWLQDCKGMAVKVIAQLLEHLPATLSYRIILMERSLDEVLASQGHMLPNNRPTDPKQTNLAKIFNAQLDKIQHGISRQPNMELLRVSHGHTIRHPEQTADAICKFSI